VLHLQTQAAVAVVAVLVAKQVEMVVQALLLLELYRQQQQQADHQHIRHLVVTTFTNSIHQGALHTNGTLCRNRRKQRSATHSCCR
jgi:predicted transposase YdaD